MVRHRPVPAHLRDDALYVNRLVAAMILAGCASSDRDDGDAIVVHGCRTDRLNAGPGS